MKAPKMLRFLLEGKTVGFILPGLTGKEWRKVVIGSEPVSLIQGGYCEDCEHWTKLTGLGVCEALAPFREGEEVDPDEIKESFAILSPLDFNASDKPQMRCGVVTAKDFGCRMWSKRQAKQSGISPPAFRMVS